MQEYFFVWFEVIFWENLQLLFSDQGSKCKEKINNDLILGGPNWRLLNFHGLIAYPSAVLYFKDVQVKRVTLKLI